MRHLVDRFASRQRSERTAKTYGAVAHAFLESVPARRAPSRHDVERFLAQPLRSGARASEATYNQKLAGLRAFAKFAIAERLWREDPTKGIEFLREPDRDPPVLGASEVQATFRAAPRVSRSEQRARDLAMLALLFLAGLRVNELVQLDVHQLDLGGSTLLGVLRKRGRVQDIPLAKGTMRLLEAWLPDRAGVAAPDEEALFVSRRGRRISVRTIQRLFERLRQRTGTAKRVTPHTARHSFITLELASGAELSVVSRLAGHASVTTTMRYRHLLDGEARSAVSLLEPLIPPELLLPFPVPSAPSTGGASPPLADVPDVERMTMPPANDTLDVQENLDDQAGTQAG